MKAKNRVGKMFFLLVILSVGPILAEQSISEQAPEAHAVSMESNDLTFSQLSQKGIAAYHNKNYTEAIGYYQQALNKRKDDVSTLNNLALALLKLDEPSTLDESIAVSNAVIAMVKKDSQKASAYFNLGKALEAKDEKESALNAYSRADELYSTDFRKLTVARLKKDLNNTHSEKTPLDENLSGSDSADYVIKNPRWEIRKGQNYSMCQEMASILNELPGDKHLKNDFPFSDKYPKFKPVPMNPVTDLTPYLPLLNEFWAIDLSRYSPPKGLTQEQAKQKKFAEWITQYEKFGVPSFYEASIKLLPKMKNSNVLFRRYPPRQVSPDEWWRLGNRISRFILLTEDGKFDKRNINHGGYGQPLFYDGLYRAADWGGAGTGVYSKKPDQHISLSDISLGGGLYITEVCKIFYQYEMESKE